MGNLEFDSTQYEPSSGYDALPAGWYECRIETTEIKETKAGTGKYLQLTLNVEGPTMKGRKLFDRLNLWNPNSTAVEIANKSLSSICLAVGIIKVRNHEELRGKALLVKVAVKDDQNEVKGYKAVDGAAKPAASGGSATASGGEDDAPRPAWAR